MNLGALSEAERRVADNIEARGDALLDDLRLHVGTATGGGYVGRGRVGLDETRNRFRARLEALGAETDLILGEARPWWLLGGGEDEDAPPTAVCRRGRSGLPRVLIAGHLDTVHDPASDFRELTIRDDGTATGPGCVDMKGGLVIAIAALEALEACGVETSWSFLMNSDEETGSYHSCAALTAEAKHHDIGLALEPALAGGELAVERLGSGQFAVRTTGRAAHVGRAFEEGVSAVTALGRCLVEIGTMPDVENGRIINVGPIRGGAATNAVPHEAWAWGNVRYPNQAVADELESMVEALATDGPGLPKVDVFTSFNRPAKPLTVGVRALAELARSAAEDLGQSLPFAKTGGVCDGNILQAAGLTTIDTLGVRGGGLHTPQEWIELASLVERCQLLAILMMRIAEGRLRTPTDE